MNKKRPATDIDSLVENNQGLVYHLALRIHRRLPVKQDLDDLIGYGMIGLVEAAKKYQPNRGIEFTTFAYPRVNGSIYDGVSKLSWMSRSRYKRLMKERARLEAESAEGDGANSTANTSTSEELINVSSLDPESAQALAVDEDDNASAHVAKIEEKNILGNLIEELPNREKRLITIVYIEGLTLQEASERLGISKSWASRMHRKTLTHLANEMRDRCR